MTFTLAESLWLHSLGFDDLLLAYPTADMGALAELGALEDDGRPIVMVDSVEHLDLIARAVPSPAAPVRVCLDMDAGFHMAGGRVKIGPKRSPVRTPPQAAALAREVVGRDGFELAGLMAYEGHIAGVGDRPRGNPLQGAVIRRMQAASASELAERRAAVVEAVSAIAPLALVNGGGTGSLHTTAREQAVTELTAGSGFYAPTLFDRYSAFSLRPAAGFALPVVRRPGADTVTLLGGGYHASGAAGKDRLPEPWLPEGLKLDSLEGAGEVQTPVSGDAARSLSAGRPRVHAPRQGGRAVRALRLAAAGQRRRRGRRGADLPRRGQDVPLVPEHATRVVVGEHAAGVQAVAGRVPVVPARVALAQRGRRLVVALAPVRAPAVGVHDGLDRAEVGLELLPAELVHGDVRACRGRARWRAARRRP